MIGLVILAIIGTWLVLSVVTSRACAAVVRGGQREDRARGYDQDQVGDSDREPAVRT